METSQAAKETENTVEKKKKKEEQETAESPEQTVVPPAEPPRKEETSREESDKDRGELDRLKAEAEDLKRKWYSVTAEYENYRKRTANLSALRYAEGRADVVCKLFPIADNLGRAIESCADEGTKKGIAMVIASFENLLKEEKIETIDPLGKEFDAEECEAIMAVDPAEGETSGVVKQVYRKGYKQNGKVLRYAQVVVVK